MIRFGQRAAIDMIETKYHAQSHKKAGRSGSRTHSIDAIVIMSLALLH